MYSFTSLIHRQRRETLEYVDLKIEFGLKGTVALFQVAPQCKEMPECPLHIVQSVEFNAAHSRVCS